ncbi:hydroxyacylglutathione hydrolase [Thalassotalea euphylliae]|uniref:hydroxyacylglutathione hydrolase n=1 Tax=Thalassotalea euphylliae TaxID=1655234 RepID=UPI00363684F8
MTITITPIPAFNDNYIWAITNNSNKLVLVDPGQAAPCFAFIEAKGLTLTDILITHHHRDHVGAIDELTSAFDGVNVYGPSYEDIPHRSVSLQGGESIHIPAIDTEFKVTHVPGHTSGHIVYYTLGALFCGDTLFSAGCGRLFEGTPEQMYNSLSTLAELPSDTKIYCAHEYTLANLDFALAVEGNNVELQRYIVRAKRLRQDNVPTLPSSIGLEKAINPFLRSASKEVKSNAEQYVNQSLNSDVEVFTAVRKWKDNF